MKKLRQGRKVARALYEQQGPEPADTDPIVGLVDTPELAARIVATVNAADKAVIELATELAEERTLTNRSQRTIDRVRALHRPVEHDRTNGPWCNECTPPLALKRPTAGRRYPCPTIRALEDQ